MYKYIYFKRKIEIVFMILKGTKLTYMYRRMRDININSQDIEYTKQKFFYLSNL